jgi:hypothetical protein
MIAAGLAESATRCYARLFRGLGSRTDDRPGARERNPGTIGRQTRVIRRRTPTRMPARRVDSANRQAAGSDALLIVTAPIARYGPRPPPSPGPTYRMPHWLGQVCACVGLGAPGKPGCKIEGTRMDARMLRLGARSVAALVFVLSALPGPAAGAPETAPAAQTTPGFKCSIHHRRSLHSTRSLRAARASISNSLVITH